VTTARAGRLLADHARELISFYPELAQYAPSAWIIWSNETKFVERKRQRVCHAELYCSGAGIYDELITAVPNKTPESIAFLTSLIEGPFSSYSDIVQLKDLDGDYYLHLSDLSKLPSSVAMNICIASRIPIEATQQLDRWVSLVNMGFSIGAAHVLCCRNYDNESHDHPITIDSKLTGLYLQVNNPNHWWFNDLSDPHRIISGNMTIAKNTPSFKKSPSFGRGNSNKIWGEADHEFLRGLQDKTLKELLEVFN